MRSTSTGLRRSLRHECIDPYHHVPASDYIGGADYPAGLASGSGIVSALGGVTAPSQQINVVSLIQEALNALQIEGEISFDGTGKGVGTPLVVDGHFGGRTFGAIKTLQAKLGLSVQEPLASVEYQALQALFAKLG